MVNTKIYALAQILVKKTEIQLSEMQMDMHGRFRVGSPTRMIHNLREKGFKIKTVKDIDYATGNTVDIVYKLESAPDNWQRKFKEKVVKHKWRQDY